MEIFDSPTVKSSNRPNDIRQSAAKSKEKIRINALKVLQFDSRDKALINESLQVALAFVNALQLSYGLTSNEILLALQDAHRAADEYYTIRHAMEWDTSFIIPAEAIAADSALFRDCHYNFSQMCRYKQNKLSHNRLSVTRIIDLFGTDGKKNPGVDPTDVKILLEFAQHGITPPVADNFRPESVNVAPLRDRYIKLQHTINRLLYKLHQDGTMIFVKKDEALRVPGLHLSPHHKAA